jgi:hypothetical protein
MISVNTFSHLRFRPSIQKNSATQIIPAH